MNKENNINKLIAPHLDEFEQYVGVSPSEVLAEREGLTLDRTIKLDANENPYGPSPKVHEALGKALAANTYPDPLQRTVRAAIAAYARAPIEQIVAGAGADELIDLTVRIAISHGDEVIDLVPTFGMYSISSQIAGAKVIPVPRKADFGVNISEITTAITGRTKIIFIANPNNPTGNLETEIAIRQLLALGPFVVVDEAYHEFSGFTVAELTNEFQNLIVIRSFSKWAGLAGIRIGYAIVAPQVAHYLMKVKSPYNISTAAEAALLASLDDTDLLLHRVRLLVEERENMRSQLNSLSSITCLPSKGNFLLCRFPKGYGPFVHQNLASKGIFVRQFSHPSLEDTLRITVGLPEHTEILIKEIRGLIP